MACDRFELSGCFHSGKIPSHIGNAAVSELYILKGNKLGTLIATGLAVTVGQKEEK